ncbi:MAG: MBL fold metallo-hydrolase [Bacillota bacterium]|nr:MBL fold metallo-hydrolase [Bacillota bacterium]MDW7682839.1 MBL fold metallo-hydrolase [Bacillota bacterium]
MALELKKITGNTYYIPGAVNTGVVVNGNDCLVIDTGLDRYAGKLLYRCLAKEDLTPRAIINTHSHADHFGGNTMFREMTDVKIYASHFEKAIIENPYLEPFYLFSAAPVKDLTTRFLMAPASPVDGILEPGPFSVFGFNVDIISLPGHSPGQIGVVTEDNVIFSADAYFGQAILEKYGMPYCADISASLDTLRNLWQSSYAKYVPCHGEPADKPTEEILKNVSVIEKTLEKILGFVEEEPRTREEVLAFIMTTEKRELNPVQYVLNHGAITACLSHLHKIGKAAYKFADGKMLWEKAPERTCSPVG